MATSPVRMRRAALVLAALSFVGLAQAKVDRVLHEPVPESVYGQANAGRSTSAARDNATTGNGKPTQSATPQAGAPTPGGAPPPAPQADNHFAIDRDTRRPNVLPYSDPFDPSVAPFKRLNSYERVDGWYLLSEGAGSGTTLSPSAADPHETVFAATLQVNVQSGAPARLPTPGPNARLVAITATNAAGKPVSVTVRADSAENWDLLTTETGTLQVRYRVAVSTESFGGDFGDPSWDSLPPVEQLPAQARESSRTALQHIGVSRSQSVRQVVQKLVAYFRAFQESNEPPPPSADVYLDLTLAQKGVCRHRAFAFLVSARSLGIPTRMITNEAHAWVEVHNGTRWKRIDLGGAGGALEASVRPPIATPPDPFAWPESADRGADLAAKATPPPAGDSAGQGGGGGGGAVNGSGPAAAAGGETNANGAPASVASMQTAPTGSTATATAAEAGDVELRVDSTTAKRGGMLSVRGSAQRGGKPCANGSVRIVLHEQHARTENLLLGTLPAREDGAFEGSVFVPRDLAPGDYGLLAEARCPGR